MRGFVSIYQVLLVSSALLAQAGDAFAQTQKQSQRKATAAPPNSGGMEVDPTPLEVAPERIDFGAVQSGQVVSVPLTLRNTGPVALDLINIRYLMGVSGDSSAFRITVSGRNYSGGASDVLRHVQPPITIGPGQGLPATLTFQPTEEQFDIFEVRLESAHATAQLFVSGLGGHAGDPYLHVAVDGPTWLVDYDGDGQEPVSLDGTGSHTHEPGHALSAFEWRVQGALLSTTTTLSTTLTSPLTQIQLEIFDDNVPPRSLAGHHDVRVIDPSAVPGVLASYYDASASGATSLLDAVPASPDFVEQRSSMSLGGAGQVGGSPFTSNVLVRLTGTLWIQEPGLYQLGATGGVDRRLFLDGSPVSQPLTLGGPHQIEARFALDTLSELPLDVTLTRDGSGVPLTEDLLTHDEAGVVPVIHAMTGAGTINGGDAITIDGFGFFPPQQVVVHWGDLDLIAADFTSIDPARIQFPSPPGGGAIPVSVENQNGVSNVRTFTYELEGPPPILFRRDLTLSVTSPTAAVWAPDGRLYVASLDGRITALEFDEDYELVSRTTYPGVSGLSNHDTLSLAINPYDPPSPVRLYVGHGDHFVCGGVTPTGPVPYTGQISVLTGPGFANPSAVITGLPVSNHDHGINGIAFDNNGDLLISVGSMTNAGVSAYNSGDLPESALSAAVLKARLSKPGFDGAISYVETQTGLTNNDMRYGEIVDVAPGADVAVQAAGLRNSYGLLYTTQGRLYATDNGPNIGFGPTSTGPQTQSTDPYDDDELDLVESGNYYGSPNRNRGRTDPRQNVYYAGLHGPPSIPNTLSQMISWLPPSSDGLDEYRANTFQGQMRGDLVIQEYQNRLRRVRMRPDGRGTQGHFLIEPNTLGLGCVTGPGGAIISLDYNHSEVEILEPNDLTSAELVVHDIFPWRAPASGGTPFVIAGRGFGTRGTTSVEIGGTEADLTDVSWGRIRGLIPARTDPSTTMLDVVVSVHKDSSTLPAAFRYLPGPGNELGRWETLANLSVPLGEVAAGVIGGTMYLVGEGSWVTLAYDVQNRQWLANKAARPLVGHHHAAEVVGGKLYLVGGLAGGSEGQLQIYDPATNTWSLGAPMPWSAGSLCTAAIDGKIYAAGGIATGGFTVGNCAVYDPLANAWTPLAPMPDGGRNHAAVATDGSKLFAFGGRRGGNFVANGYDSVMVYDPASDSWAWSGANGSVLARLPEARGGMGKAVFLRGEFFVFGGETLNDPDANASGVYDRVDVYDPVANAWRSEARMPNPRHGIFPVLYQGHIFLAGGGTHAGNSQSILFDTFTRQ